MTGPRVHLQGEALARREACSLSHRTKSIDSEGVYRYAMNHKKSRDAASEQ
jgi:hypothetical protein